MKIEQPTPEEKIKEPPGMETPERGDTPPEVLTPEERLARLEKFNLSLGAELRAFAQGMDAKLEAIKVAAPAGSAGGIMGMLKDYQPLLSQLMGSAPNPMDDLAVQIGHKFIDGTIDVTLKRVMKQLGGEVASHVTV